jgi:hypothetical protein
MVTLTFLIRGLLIRKPYSGTALSLAIVLFRRQAIKARPQKPKIIMAHVEGSGTEAGRSTRFGFGGSFDEIVSE